MLVCDSSDRNQTLNNSQAEFQVPTNNDGWMDG